MYVNLEFKAVDDVDDIVVTVGEKTERIEVDKDTFDFGTLIDAIPLINAALQRLVL